MEEGFISAHRMRDVVHLGGKARQEAAAGWHNCMRFAFTSADQEAERGTLVLNLFSVLFTPSGILAHGMVLATPPSVNPLWKCSRRLLINVLGVSIQSG